MDLQPGINRIETTHTVHADGDRYRETLVVFDVKTHAPSTWLLRCTDREGVEFVVTSILEAQWNDDAPSWNAKGRKLRKDGTAFRSDFGEYLGYIGTSFFGADLT